MKLSSGKNNKGAIGAAMVLAGFGALMYLKNRMAPKYADDYAFSFVWDGKHHGNLAYGDQEYKRVRNLRDLAKSQVSHYLTWSGRTVAETLNQLVLIKDGRKLYDIINTGAILSQILLCAKAGRGAKKSGPVSASLAALLSAGYWFCTPRAAHTVFWTTGAANYSWPGLFQSAFLLPYGFRYHDAAYEKDPVLMGALGLLSGWSNEAGGALCLMLSGLSCLCSKRRGEDTGWMKAGFAGVCIGYALLMLAPGNFKRFQLEKEYSDIMSESFNGLGNVSPQYVYTRRMFESHFKNGFLPVAAGQLPLQIPVVLYLLQKTGRKKEDMIYLALLELSALGVPSLLMLSPEFPVRAAYPSVLFSLAASAFAFEHTDPAFLKEWERLGKVAGFAAAGAFAVNYAASLIADADLHCETDAQIIELIERKDEDDVILPNVSIPPFWSRLAGSRSLDEDMLQATWLDKNSRDPYNKAVAAYYGTKSFSVRDVSEHPYRQKGRKALIYSIKKPCRSLIKRIRTIFGLTDEDIHEALR